MIKTVLSDFSQVLLFPKDKTYLGSLNRLYEKVSGDNNFRFFDHFVLNNELLEFYASLKDKFDLYIYTSEHIQDAPELQPFLNPIFKEIFSAKKLNLSKKESSSYKLLAEEIGVKPSEILFIDDNKDNIIASKEAGLSVVHFTSNASVMNIFN